MTYIFVHIFYSSLSWMPAATCGSITFNNHPGPPGNRPRCHCHHQGDGAWWSAPENSELDSKWIEVTQDCILKWIRLKFGSMTFETPQTILQTIHELVLPSIFHGQIQIAAYLRRPSPEQLLARQYHARPVRAGATLEEAQNTSKTTRYSGQFSTHANLSPNNIVGSHSDSAENSSNPLWTENPTLNR